MSRLYSNSYRSYTTAAITNSATTLYIGSATGLPTLTGNRFYYLTLDDLQGTREIVKVTAISSLTLTIVRAQESTTAVAWAAYSLVELRPTAASYVPVESWTAYTPTFTGFGTVSGVQIQSRRVNDSLEIRGRFTAGTSTAVEAQMTLGHLGTSANATSSTSLITAIQLAGAGVFDFNAALHPTILIEATKTYLTFGLQGGANAGLTKVNGSALLTSGQTISIQASVPINGW